MSAILCILFESLTIPSHMCLLPAIYHVSEMETKHSPAITDLFQLLKRAGVSSFVHLFGQCSHVSRLLAGGTVVSRLIFEEF